MHVEGVSDARRTGITVKCGQFGILAERTATVELRDVSSRDNASHGVEVINAFVDAEGLHSHDACRVGIDVNRSSEARRRNAVAFGGEHDGERAKARFMCWGTSPVRRRAASASLASPR